MLTKQGDLATIRVLLIAEEEERAKGLLSELLRTGLNGSLASGREALTKLAEQAPDLVLLEMNDYSTTRELAQKIKEAKALPIITLIRRAMLESVEGDLNIDDFIIQPGDVAELVLRIKRLLRVTNHRDSDEVIKCRDLVIDPAKCEVTLAGRRLTLAFKEYQLLKFLATNRERVFTREALLNKVWGYDYYGGDRTVDVHIRRLRSKTEDATHTFIETVRNIGYRFSDNL